MPHGHTTFQYEFRTHSAKIVQSVESNYLIQRYDWLFFIEYKNQLVLGASEFYDRKARCFEMVTLS